MTETQYGRWKDFAERMARTCFRGYRRPTSTWIVEQVDRWFVFCHPEEWAEYQSWDGEPGYLCDQVSDFYQDITPHRWCRRCRHDRDYRANWRACADGTCRTCNLKCECDQIECVAYEQFSQQWLGPVRCCLRAGIDTACSLENGVIGFTAGDIRRMFPEGVPEWVFPPDEQLVGWMDDAPRGVFAALADDARIVL